MKTKFKVYSYVTPDNKPGTLIVHPDLTEPFDTQMLFEMDDVAVAELSLYDILAKGFIKIGSTDTMDEMDIQYPMIENTEYPKNRITGRHWTHSPQTVANVIGREFEVDEPAFGSDTESESDTRSTIELNDIDHSFVDFDQDSESDAPERDMLVQETPMVLNTALTDGKIEEIFDKIEDCENTAVKEVDRLLSEF